MRTSAQGRVDARIQLRGHPRMGVRISAYRHARPHTGVWGHPQRGMRMSP